MENNDLREKYKVFNENNDYMVSYYLGLANTIEKIDCDEMMFYPAYLLACNYYVTWLNVVYMFSNVNSVFKDNIIIDRINEYELKTISGSDEQKLKKCGVLKKELSMVINKFNRLKNLYNKFLHFNTNLYQREDNLLNLDVNCVKDSCDEFIAITMKIYYYIVEFYLKSWALEAELIKDIDMLEMCNKDYLHYFGKSLK